MIKFNEQVNQTVFNYFNNIDKKIFNCNPYSGEHFKDFFNLVINFLNTLNIKYYYEYMPNDIRINILSISINNKLIITLYGTCSDIENIKIYLVNTNIDYTTKHNIILFTLGSKTGSISYYDKEQKKYITIDEHSSEKDRLLYVEMKQSKELLYETEEDIIWNYRSCVKELKYIYHFILKYC